MVLIFHRVVVEVQLIHIIYSKEAICTLFKAPNVGLCTEVRCALVLSKLHIRVCIFHTLNIYTKVVLYYTDPF